jgi:signal transduction histidine kinase
VHPLLERQVRKVFEGRAHGEELAALLSVVDAAYADDDRKQLERSLNLASEELFERRPRLAGELEERERLELDLRTGAKLPTVGRLAAGIAHEINTPLQFVGDSLHFLREAFADVVTVLDLCEPLPAATAPTVGRDFVVASIRGAMAGVDLPSLREEIPRALVRCESGIERVANTVRALKALAHPDAREPDAADVNGASSS